MPIGKTVPMMPADTTERQRIAEDVKRLQAEPLALLPHRGLVMRSKAALRLLRGRHLGGMRLPQIKLGGELYTRALDLARMLQNDAGLADQ